MMVEFEWHEKKRQANILKHGIDFEDAVCVFDGATVQRLADRSKYGEERIVAIGEIDGHVLIVVYTMRGDIRRLISARVASRDERAKYHQAIAGRSPDG
ncbi:MAG: BrnT family toxin [Alphaproteobacteria bacterium]|nr:BrnT family toxin [Alphaproteobacteria bacterium]